MGTHFTSKGQPDGDEEIDDVLLHHLHDTLHGCFGIEMLTAIGTLEVVLPEQNAFVREMAAACDDVIYLA